MFEELRKGTEAQHREIEKTLDLLNPQLSLNAYLNTLQCFLTFYDPIEKIFENCFLFKNQRYDFEGRRKCPLIVRDLQALLPEKSIAIVPYVALPKLTSMAQIAGCAYVLEGATLGGQIITRHVSATLGLSSEFGCSFFYGYGAQTGARWKLFHSVLLELKFNLEERVEMVHAAQNTFGALNQCFLSFQQSHKSGTRRAV